MLLGHDEGGEDLYVSIPHGGPIYVPELVGPLTRVPDFETCVIEELQSLEEELSADSTEMCDEEILVDDLKIIREDELVNKAFEEAFKRDGELAIDASQDTEEHLSTRKTDDNCASAPEHGSLQNPEGDTKAIVSSESSNVLPLRICDTKKSNKSPSRKRKKRKHDSRKNHSSDVLIHNVVIYGFLSIVVFSTICLSSGKAILQRWSNWLELNKNRKKIKQP